jgi:hypothetical protein
MSHVVMSAAVLTICCGMIQCMFTYSLYNMQEGNMAQCFVMCGLLVVIVGDPCAVFAVIAECVKVVMCCTPVGEGSFHSVCLTATFCTILQDH